MATSRIAEMATSTAVVCVGATQSRFQQGQSLKVQLPCSEAACRRRAAVMAVSAKQQMVSVVAQCLSLQFRKICRIDVKALFNQNAAYGGAPRLLWPLRFSRKWQVSVYLVDIAEVSCTII